MRTIAIDDPDFCQSVSLSVKSEKVWIDVLFGVETPGDPRNIVLDVDPHLHGKVEGVWCGLCQITLATCACILFI